jgi:hypothetical protein
VFGLCVCVCEREREREMEREICQVVISQFNHIDRGRERERGREGEREREEVVIVKSFLSPKKSFLALI